MLLPVLGSKLKRVLAFFGQVGASFNWKISDVIVPVMEVSGFVRDAAISVEQALDLNVTTNTFVVAFTVPDRKRWTIRALYREGTTGASYIGIKPTSGTGLTNVMILTIPGTGTAVWTGDIALLAGWTIGMQGTLNGADTAIDIRCYCIEEDA